MQETTKIFVYGTLKHNCCNHHITRQIKAKYISKVKTKDFYPLYPSQYYFPYLEDQEGIGKIVIGELYEVPTTKMSILDEFEGVPDLYKKGLIDLVDEEGKEFLGVSVYFKSKDTFCLHRELIDEWKEE